MIDAADVPDVSVDDLGPPLASDDTETDEEPMLDGTSPDLTARTLTLPPHIAARFYRSSTAQARRKNSAASSRRNSISSSHSRSSHGYAYGPNPPSSSTAPQSKHVAQHLRRASILADRKARLADRAAHAEQVRLRAALAKAAVRDISQSEERAQAAAQAREKKLEEIAAACAEEVKRAKAVASMTKEKREQDLLRLHQQIQVRLDEAERRREELRRNNAGRTRTRGQSIANSRKQVEVMPQVAELKESLPQDPAQSQNEAAMLGSSSADANGPASNELMPEEAAFKILNWWRKNHRRKAIAAFQQLGLAVDDIRDTSFDTVVEMLGQDKVLMTTGRILRLCGIQEGKTSSVKEIVVIRTFLSAFLILGHPTQVLRDKDGAQDVITSSSSTGTVQSSSAPSSSNATPSHLVEKDDEGATNPQQQDLVGKAKDLLICFETIVSRLAESNGYTPPLTLASELVEAYDSFYDAFISWKARDASALVDVMLKQFVELDAIWQTVKDDTNPSVSDTYRQSIQKNQLLLMVRIKKLAGPEEGKKKIFAAVRKARKAKEEASRKAVATAANNAMKPREAESACVETAMGNLAGDSIRGRDAATTHKGSSLSTKTALPNSPGLTGRAETDTMMASLLPRAEPSAEANTEAKLRSLRFAPIDRKYSSSPLPENRVVVHELAINHKFRISPTQFQQQQAIWMAPIFRRMRKTLASSSKEDRDEHFYYLLVVADLIRSKMEHLLTPGKRTYQLVCELLDTEVARQQIERGSFSYERFFSSIGQLLPMLCAPVRDEEVKDLVDNKLHEGNYVDRLQALLAFIDVMLTDHINFMITVAAPQLQTSATVYETTRFMELVNGGGAKGADDMSVDARLPVATNAWRTARNKVLAEVAKRDPEGINHPKHRPTRDQFYTTMLVDVFTQLSAIPLDEVPEMLQLDQERAQKWGAVTRRIVTTGALLLQCKNLLKRDVRLPWKTEAHRVMAVLEKAEKDAAQPPSARHNGRSPENDHENEQQATQADMAPSAVAARLSTALKSNSVIDGVMSALESGRSMPSTTRAQLRSFVQRTMEASAEAAVSRNSSEVGGGDALPREPVLRLLLHRLRGYLGSRLAVGSSTEKTRQANTVGERLTSLGLAEFGDRVRELVDEVSRVAEVDRATHAAFWDAVASQVETESAVPDSSS